MACRGIQAQLVDPKSWQAFQPHYLVTCRLSWARWDGCLIGVDVSISPNRHPCHTHTGFVTFVVNAINPINERCCQRHRLTVDISLYCRGSRESRAGVRFVLQYLALALLG